MCIRDRLYPPHALSNFAVSEIPVHPCNRNGQHSGRCPFRPYEARPHRKRKGYVRKNPLDDQY